MSKTAKFRELILEGKSVKEAKEEAGVADGTAHMQMYRLKKEGLVDQDGKLVEQDLGENE